MDKRVMVDTNIFYMLLLGSEDEARRLTAVLEGRELYTAPIVIAELLHILTYRYLKRLGVVRGPFSMRRWVRAKGYPPEVIGAIVDILEALNPFIVPEVLTSWSEVIDVAGRYRLPTNDALIAVTCRRHGISVIATLDEDFKRVPWLKVIP